MNTLAQLDAQGYAPDHQRLTSPFRKRSLTLLSGALLIHLLALAYSSPAVIAVTKVALMPLLWLVVKGSIRKLPIGWTVAILFSWIGDILLLPQWGAKGFFLAGMGAFLVAQLSYCRLLWMKGARLGVVSIGIIVSIVAAVEWGLSFTSADLVLRSGVGVYGACLLAMLMLSLSLKQELSSFVKLAAILFVLSDSLIALRMFVLPEGFATSTSIAVMLTYGIAQLGLVWLLLLTYGEEN